MGDLLFSIANLARKMGIEPEAALRKANAKFTGRFEALEARLDARGTTVHDAALDEMEAVWQEVKAENTRRIDPEAVECTCLQSWRMRGSPGDMQGPSSSSRPRRSPSASARRRRSTPWSTR